MDTGDSVVKAKAGRGGGWVEVGKRKGKGIPCNSVINKKFKLKKGVWLN